MAKKLDLRLGRAIIALEKTRMLQALGFTGVHITAAAGLLGMPRRSFYVKMGRYGINPTKNEAWGLPTAKVDISLAEEITVLEQQLIKKALAVAGTLTGAARLLGISRRTLYQKIAASAPDDTPEPCYRPPSA